MRLIKASNGKTRVTLSKKEWKEIGRTAGWMKIAQSDDLLSFEYKITFYNSDSGETYGTIHETVKAVNNDEALSEIDSLIQRHYIDNPDNLGNELGLSYKSIIRMQDNYELSFDTELVNVG
jgi:hypothetical protein